MVNLNLFQGQGIIYAANPHNLLILASNLCSEPKSTPIFYEFERHLTLPIDFFPYRFIQKLGI